MRRLIPMAVLGCVVAVTLALQADDKKDDAKAAEKKEPAGKFDYINTFYDREPRIDITEPHPDRHGTYDFILSSDVFEHIGVPVERAFDEVYKLLKPHGVLCLTVPFSLKEQTVEHFPELTAPARARSSASGGIRGSSRRSTQKPAQGPTRATDAGSFHGARPRLPADSLELKR